MPEITAQKLFIIEGNIGVGKSTILKIIKEYLNVQVVAEPLARWQDVGGKGNILDNFYKDTPRWAYTMQSYAFITRVFEQESQAKINPYQIQVLERSVYSDRYCFAKNCFELGAMTELEWQLYKEWFSWLVDTYTKKPDGFIYLRANPTTCYERILKRKRNEEDAVPFSYLEKVHQKHEDWLVSKKDITPALKETPVLILECDVDFENNQEIHESLIEKIGSFVYQVDSGLVDHDTQNRSLFL